MTTWRTRMGNVLPWPNQEAYEMGCSRDCRETHSLRWGACELAVPPPPRLNLSMWHTWIAEDGVMSGGHSSVTVEEAQAEIARYLQAMETYDEEETG